MKSTLLPPMAIYLPLNEGLFDYISRQTDEPFIAHKVYAKWLKECAPQVNVNTKIAAWPAAPSERLAVLNAVQGAQFHESLRPGWKARLWRILGELFNQEEWRSRGRYSRAAGETRQLVLKMWGYYTADNFTDAAPTYKPTVVKYAYDCLTDTLWLKDVEIQTTSPK